MVKKGEILPEIESKRDAKSAFNRELWLCGILIGDAWLELAPSHDRARYSELEKAADVLAAVNAAKPTSPLEISKVISAAFNSGRERDTMAEELREGLLDRLFNDELHAYGYRVAPSRSRHPTRIAPDLFENPKVDWGDSELTARGLKYEGVKVLGPDRIANQAKRRGRVGSAATIREAIKQIKNSNVDICGMRRKDACNVIRTHIGEIAESGLGLTNQNISKYILEFCPKRSLDNKSIK